MNTNFKSFAQYNEDSFRDMECKTYNARTATNSFIQFHCRSPGGSVLLADPVLETRFVIDVFEPSDDLNGGITWTRNRRPNDWTKIVCCGGAVPV